jgi:hypothetical protein
VTAVRAAELRAARLVRLYPRTWRDRYGAELTELLIADIAERPRCRRRTADLVRAATVERLAAAGLAAGTANSPQRALLAVGAATIGFLALASSLWAQLLGGSLALSGPEDTAARLGTSVLTLTAGFFAVLILLAAAPLSPVLARAVRRQGAAVRRPAALVVAGIAILAVGGHRFAGQWPALGAHPGLTTRVGGYSWAETLGISTYWVHPHRLLALPAGELIWMAVSPVSLLIVFAGLVTLVRRVSVPARLLRYEARLATVAAIGMAPALAAATAWVVSSQRAPNAMLRAGTLDLFLIAGMAVAVAAAGVAAERVRPAAGRGALTR